MNIYKNGNCLIGMEEVVVKKDFDLFLAGNVLQIRDNKTENLAEMIDFSKISNSGFTKDIFCSIIDLYGEIKKYCYAEVTLSDMIAIISVLVNNLPISEKCKCRALEIGSWGGASSYCISKVLKSVGEDNRLVCMDTWKGTPNTNSHQIANYEDMFCHFRTAMSYFGVSDIIIPIIASSEYGLGLLENYSYDVIFIDATHIYSGVIKDIQASIKKVKKGGILMGHDCECYYDELPEIGMNKDVEEIRGYHVGVIKALHDTFGEDFDIVPGSKVWYRIM